MADHIYQYGGLLDLVRAIRASARTLIESPVCIVLANKSELCRSLRLAHRDGTRYRWTVYEDGTLVPTGRMDVWPDGSIVRTGHPGRGSVASPYPPGTDGLEPKA